MEENQKYFFNSTDLFAKAYNNRKLLISVTAGVAIISIIVSLLITPMYKASVILFPAPSASLAQSLISTTNSYKVPSVFGEEEEVEQILQVLNSDEIMHRLSSKYNLMKHYEIDPEEKYAKSKLYQSYKSNISFKRTEYMAVEIIVLDKSPDTAALIANDCTRLVDTVLNKMEQGRAMEALAIVEDEYNKKLVMMQVLEDSLKTIMKKGIYDYESQSEVYNSAYAEALANGNMKGAQKLEEKLQILSEYGSKYVALRDLHEFETEQLSDLSQKLKEAKVNAEKTLTHVMVVNDATVPDKKHSPRRSLIVLVSTFASFILTFISLMFVDLLKTIKTTENK